MEGRDVAVCESVSVSLLILNVYVYVCHSVSIPFSNAVGFNVIQFNSVEFNEF